MKIHLVFLTAFIASFELLSAQPRIETGIETIADEVNADSKVQQNVRSLFNSLSKNDMEKADSLRDSLEREAAREQKAFYSMRDGLRLAHGKKAHRQNSYGNGSNGEGAAVFKREAATFVKPKTKPHPAEDAYVAHFNNDPAILIRWFRIRNWWFVPGEAELKKYCAEIHELAGLGKAEVNYVFFSHRWLKFRNPFYATRQAEMVEYGIASKSARSTTVSGRWKLKEKGKRWFISKGTKPECVFMLKLVDRESNMFMLEREVCGIKDISPFTTPNLEEALRTVEPFSGGTGMYPHEKALGTPGPLD